MTRFRTLDHPMIGMIAWDPARPAEWINDHIAIVHATSNAYVVVGDEGDVVINTGTAQQGEGIRAKFEALTPRAGRCPPHWIARAVFEEYAGWFHHDHTSELYPTPASAVWAEVVEAMGGAEAVAIRAQTHLAAGETEKALHLIEMAVDAEPDCRQARSVELAVYEALADQTGGEIFDLLGWLEGKIIATRAALSAMG